MKNILFLILLSSCTLIRETRTNSAIVPLNPVKAGGNEKPIVFAVLKIKKDSATAKTNVGLVSIIETAGTVKAKKHNLYENYLTIFLYNNSKLVDSLTIEHPLFKHVEYLDDMNSFRAKEIELDSAEFFIRMQLERNSSEIRIFETLKNKSKEELNTIKL
jgi:hypothetical protein